MARTGAKIGKKTRFLREDPFGSGTYTAVSEVKRVALVHPAFKLSGGVKRLFTIAKLLRERGYEAIIYSNALRMPEWSEHRDLEVRSLDVGIAKRMDGIRTLIVSDDHQKIGLLPARLARSRDRGWTRGYCDDDHAELEGSGSGHCECPCVRDKRNIT